jgi:hypothetical protein
MATQPSRSWYDRPSVVTCVPCQRRARSLGGHKAQNLYLVGGRRAIEGGHLVYQDIPQRGGGDVLLCLAKGRPLTDAAAEGMAVGPVGQTMTWNVYREDDGAEIDSEMNPAGSWLVNRIETDDGQRWSIQRPWYMHDEDRDRLYDSEIAAIADAVAGMVASGLSGDEQDGDRD